LGAQEELSQCNIWAAWAGIYSEDIERELVEESMAVGTRIGQPALVWDALLLQARRAIYLGAYDEAERHSKMAFRVSRDAGQLYGTLWSTIFLGNVSHLEANYVKASQYYRQGLTLSERIKDRLLVGGLYADLGGIALVQKEYEQARWHYGEALMRSEEAGSYRGTSRALGGLGNVALATGDRVRARAHFRRALQLAVDKTDELSCAEALIGPSVWLMREAMAEHAAEVLTLVLETGTYSMPARDTAFQLLDELRTEFSPAAFVAIQERGRTLDLWTTVEEMLVKLEQEGKH
jgi:tetratricopeptide (TPR) repeat protein